MYEDLKVGDKVWCFHPPMFRHKKDKDWAPEPPTESEVTEVKAHSIRVEGRLYSRMDGRLRGAPAIANKHIARIGEEYHDYTG